MKQPWLGIHVGALLLLFTAPARTEPRFAVRQGVACSACHINRTGGGMRNAYGITFSARHLATLQTEGIIDPRVNDDLALGANLRLVNRTRLATQTELDGVRKSAETSNSFEISEGNLYVRADLSDSIALYFDETMAPEGASSREALILIGGLPLDGYVKAGRMLLPYGLRIPDDAAYIRQETGFTYANQDLGIELGGEAGPVQVAVAVSNGSLGGSDPNLEKQITGRAELVSSRGRVGISGAYNDTSTQDFGLTTLTTGTHAGVRIGRLLLLGELDWIRADADGQISDQLALYSEASFEVVRGFFPRVVFEAFDPLRSLDENERDRIVMGASWFPVGLIELRTEYRVSRDIPQRVEGNIDEVIVEIHGFF